MANQDDLLSDLNSLFKKKIVKSNETYIDGEEAFTEKEFDEHTNNGEIINHKQAFLKRSETGLSPDPKFLCKSYQGHEVFKDELYDCMARTCPNKVCILDEGAVIEDIEIDGIITKICFCHLNIREYRQFINQIKRKKRFTFMKGFANGILDLITRDDYKN